MCSLAQACGRLGGTRKRAARNGWVRRRANLELLRDRRHVSPVIVERAPPRGDEASRGNRRLEEIGGLRISTPNRQPSGISAEKASSCAANSRLREIPQDGSG